MTTSASSSWILKVRTWTWSRRSERAACPGMCVSSQPTYPKGFQVTGVLLFSLRYEYLRREGNFERSAGLQIGVDTIEVRNTNTRQQYVSWQGKATSSPFGTVTDLTESQNKPIMHNQYLSAGTVCRASRSSRRGSCFHPSSPAVGDRESLRQFAAFPLSSVRHSCHIHLFHRLFLHTCVCACARVPLHLFPAVPLSYTRANPHTRGVQLRGNWTDVDLAV